MLDNALNEMGLRLLELHTAATQPFGDWRPHKLKVLGGGGGQAMSVTRRVYTMLPASEKI